MTTTDQNVVYNKQHPLRTFHLFCGAGGGVLADILLGHIPVGACEIEEYPRNVLLQRQRDGILPPFPIWDDIRTLDGRPWRGLVDVVAGGFPCQDISAAGKGAGIDGDRSGMWREMRRVVGEIRPRKVFVENSPLLVGRGLARVIGDLTEMRYSSRWCVLGAGHIGAWHLRERLWLVATDDLQERVKGERQEPIQREFRIPGSENVGRFEDLQSRSDLPEPLIRGDRNGVPAFVDRIAAIGNAQCPQVAATAWRILTEEI
jgi:DNA (cytosine-5)-methyltransferase 1